MSNRASPAWAVSLVVLTMVIAAFGPLGAATGGPGRAPVGPSVGVPALGAAPAPGPGTAAVSPSPSGSAVDPAVPRPRER